MAFYFNVSLFHGSDQNKGTRYEKVETELCLSKDKAAEEVAGLFSFKLSGQSQEEKAGGRGVVSPAPGEAVAAVKTQWL